MTRNPSSSKCSLSISLGLSTFLCAVAASAQIGYGVDSDSDADNLYLIDLSTGVASVIGPTGRGDIEGLAFSGGVLYGVDDADNSLVGCNIATGACSFIGGLGVSVTDPGLGAAPNGTLYLVDEGSPGELYTVNPATGLATLVGTLGGDVEGQSIAFGAPTAGCASGAFLIDPNEDPAEIYCVDLGTGAATLVGDFGAAFTGLGNEFQAMDFDANGVLWALDETNLQIVTVNTTTGAPTDVGYDLTGFLDGVGADSLAILSVATAVPVGSGAWAVGLVALLGVAGVVVLRRALT
jgi:hypothetical protein